MGRMLSLIVLVVGTSLMLLPRECSAQQFSFSIGHGHGHRHHHGWSYHHCWHDPFWWGPPVDYVYVAPPPPRVIYVEPRVAREIDPEPAARTKEAPPWSSTPARTRPAADSTLQIWNGGGQKIAVAFLVDSRHVELHDGQSHSLHGNGKRIIEFDRGGTFGTARYELTGGQYEFVITGRGWDLVRKASATPGISLRPLVKKNVLPGDTVTR